MRKLTLSLAVMAALLPSHVLPLGLGEIELNSALNQELNAEIKVLSAAPEDAEQLIVKLASREAFARAGIDRPFSLQDLKFRTILKGNVPYIQVYTTESVREPFLSFLVEIDWPNGHLLREYTLLLDPPVFNAGPGDQSFLDDGGDDQAFFDPAEVSAEPAATDRTFLDDDEEEVMADAGFDASAPVQQFNAVPAPAVTEDAMPVLPAGQQAARPAPQYSQQVSGQYRVQEHDTLWSLADKLRPNADVSIEQMMLALVQENPESFIKENINGIKRGYILRMPEGANITAIDRQTALEQVRRHNALWREYRQTMSASVPASAMEAEDTGIERQEPTTEGRLNIVSAAGGQPGSEAALGGQDPKSQVTQLKRELSVAQETLESERLEKENLRERLAELEQRVQRVLEMDDAELAKLQADLAGTKKQAEKLAGPAVTTPAVSPGAENIAPQPAEIKTPEQIEQALTDGEQPLFVDETATGQADLTEPTEPAMDAGQVEPVTPAQPPVPQPQPAPDSGLMGLLASPVNLAVLGGVAVLVLGLIAMILRRRRAAQTAEDSNKWVDMDQPINFDDAVEAVGEPYVKNRDADATAEMRVTDTAPKQADMQDTVIGMPGDEQAAEEQRDDVLAEADVYLAYGIYQQAEDLLQNALRQHPERDDYRMKLLETHFASKNAAAFTELAKEAKQRKGSVKSYWDRVVVMGRELCPDVAMFSDGAALLPGFDADDLLPQKPQTTDFELDVGGMAPDLDIGFTETPAAKSKPARPDADLDFSLDMDATTAQKKPDIASAPAMPELDLAADLENIANAMELSAGSKSKEKENLSADLDLGDIGDLDFSTDSLALDTDMSAGGGIDDDFALDFEASDLGLATDSDDSTAMDTSLDLAMDDMDLSMDAEPEPAKPAQSARSSMAMDAGGDDDFDISQLSEDVDEVTTKLDLARAYMDMGDNEGARNILEEVKSEGNPAQKKQAEELMAKAS